MKAGPAPIGLLLASLAIPQGVHAQPSTTPEPILQVTIDPPRVAVGQKTTLRLQVLAPNYMTAPPELPNFQLRNVVTRQLQSVNRSEARNGTTYAGVQFEFAIYPQEAGSYAVTGQRLTVRYAAEPPATREQALELPRVEFQAFIPQAAARLRPFISASHLTIEQSLQRSSEKLKPGDAVTRIVTIKADGTPAMLLPPVRFAAIDGLHAYSAQPSLEDQMDSRTDALSSIRVDTATYMVERPGDYLLPAIDVSWWNSAAEKVEVAHLDGLTLKVADNPAGKTSPPSGESLESRWDMLTDYIAGHPLLAVLSLMVLAALAWLAPKTLRRIVVNYRWRLQVYRQSEACSFRQLRLAARRADARAVYFALMAWLQRFAGITPVATIDGLKKAARDPQLARQLDALQTVLFAPGLDAADWSPRRMLRRVSAARRRLRRQSRRPRGSRSLPQQLNPVEDPRAALNTWRAPAR